MNTPQADAGRTESGMAPGVYRGKPEAWYHALPHVSKSRLWRMHNLLPLEFDPEALRQLIQQDRPESDALLLGRLTDDLLFSGRDEVMKRYKVGPTKTTGTKKWREREAELEGTGIGLVTEGMLASAENMAHSISRHPIASDLLMHGKGHSQLSVVADDQKTGLRCKARIDRLTAHQGDSAHVDLKTCRSIEWFRKDAEDFGYWIQAAHYLDLCERIDELNGNPPRARRFIFVAVEKTDSKEAPGRHKVEVFEYDLNSLDSALRMRDTLLEQWRLLHHENKYPAAWPEVKRISISQRAESQMEPQR